VFHAQVTVLSLFRTVEYCLVHCIIPRTGFVVIQATNKPSFRCSSDYPSDESLISYFNIIFDFVLFKFKFILFEYYFLLDLFYFDCILLYFRNEYLIDSVLEQNKED